MASLLLFTVTLFVGSTLLFMVQPMYGKMVLPLLGGSPSVWNTCMVFFQLALLAGYAYSHIAVQRLTPRKMVVLHLVVLLTPLLVLPIQLGSRTAAPIEANPVPWLLGLLTLTVGLPFVALATGAPMLQRWFSYTDHPSAQDPYFLYAASNLGSMVGLIGYLVVVEPRLSLPDQSRAWAFGFVLYLILVASCGVTVFRHTTGPVSKARRAKVMAKSVLDDAQACSRVELPSEEAEPISWRRSLMWVLLAFAPSSLLLGLTTYLSTDVAAVPLLWAAPLALYLLTFMAAFAKRRPIPASAFSYALPMLALLQLVVLRRGALPLPASIALHLSSFVCVAMICHYRLASDRPDVRGLTGFYLLISIGGALGGAFNALIAPHLFRSVVEYPLILVIACALIQRPKAKPASPGTTKAPSWSLSVNDLYLPAAVAILALGIDFAVNSELMHLSDLASKGVYGLLALACFAAVEKPVRFSLAIGAILLVYALQVGAKDDILWQDRSFFGVVRISRNLQRNTHVLTHGTTVHGQQSRDLDRHSQALTYYHRTGPMGQAIACLQAERRFRSFAVVGLGTGSLAAYCHNGDRMTFYEIDPMMGQIASDSGYFTFIRDAQDRGATITTVLGDARLTLARADGAAYDLLVLDAFSSDAIPVHLLTIEAFKLYASRLSDHGVLAVHISNRYLNLAPIVGRLADDSGMLCIQRRDITIPMAESNEGKTPSDWLLLARHRDDLGTLMRDPRWKPVQAGERSPLWSDDYSNILAAIRILQPS